MIDDTHFMMKYIYISKLYCIFVKTCKILENVKSGNKPWHEVKGLKQVNHQNAYNK